MSTDHLDPMPVGTKDLRATLSLVQSIIHYKSNAFQDASSFVSVSMDDLKFWHGHCQPLLRFFEIVDVLDLPQPVLDKQRNQTLSIIFEFFKKDASDPSGAWVKQALEHSINIALKGLERLLDTIAQGNSLVPSKTLDSQEMYAKLRNFAMAIEVLTSHQWPFSRPDALFVCLFSVLTRIADQFSVLSCNRLRKAIQVNSRITDQDVEAIEIDLVSARIIGTCLVPVDSYFVSSFNPVLEIFVQQMHKGYKAIFANVGLLDETSKVSEICKVMNTRLRILKLIRLNKRLLNMRNALTFEHNFDDMFKMLDHIYLEGFYLAKVEDNDCPLTVFVSPYLAQNPKLFKPFFESQIKRSDIFSDDFVFAVPSAVFAKYPARQWREIKMDYPAELMNVEETERTCYLYGHCFSMLVEFVGGIKDIGIDVHCKPFNPAQRIAFFTTHYDEFLQFIADSCKLLIALPISLFKAKELIHLWDVSISFWDFCETFVTTDIPSHGLWENEDAIAELSFCALILLKLACMNIRMSYLEPFTWAANILERFSSLMVRRSPEFIRSFMSLKELEAIYTEFQQKWGQIEAAANRQWDNCVVFRKEITELQIAAHNLERAFWMASKFLPGVKPLEKISDHFLLNIMSPTKSPAFLYAESKNLKIISNLKRKQWIETYCCYDLENRLFVSMKEIKLINGALDVAKKMGILERYSNLIKIKHPNLAKYYSVDLVGDTLFIIAEFCAKRSLHSFLADHGHVKDERLFKEFCRNILFALVFLHSRGIAHGDIQPGNILQDRYDIFKFIDYGGVNRDFKAALSKIDLSYMSNTVPYMAPEVVINAASYDALKTDVWSFGCLLIELVTGCRPWHELEHDYAIVFRLGATKFLPEALMNLPLSPPGCEFVKSCLIHDPEERPSALELLKSPYLSLV